MYLGPIFSAFQEGMNFVSLMQINIGKCIRVGYSERNTLKFFRGTSVTRSWVSVALLFNAVLNRTELLIVSRERLAFFYQLLSNLLTPISPGVNNLWHLTDYLSFLEQLFYKRFNLVSLCGYCSKFWLFPAKLFNLLGLSISFLAYLCIFEMVIFLPPLSCVKKRSMLLLTNGT